VLAESRTATLADPTNPLSLTGETTTLVRNGRTYTRTFAAAGRTVTEQSPAGRQRVQTLDAKGRVLSDRLGGRAPTNVSYDAQGRLITATRGTSGSARTFSMGYDTLNRLVSVTDPLSRTLGFTYNDADRVVTETLPDARQVRYTYDADGNLTSVTPPGRPTHTSSYTAVNLESAYVPPDVGAGPTATIYSYNLDRQLTRITQPDSQTVELGYDSGGRLSTVTTAVGVSAYAYHPTTGNLSSVAAPDGGVITYAYDGHLPTGTAWTGSMAGSGTRIYDSSSRVSSTSVNGGQTVSFQYDADGLLTQAGSLTLTRDPQTGLATGSTLGQVADTLGYNELAEVTTYSASTGGTPVLSVSYTRDAIGRITEKVETVLGQTDTYTYGYDPGGYLTSVMRDGLPSVTYGYDANGNRLTRVTGVETETGIYDDQDRILAYDDAVYSYTANGELLTKTNSGQTTTYSYDQLGELRDVTLPNGTAIEYLIDGENRRIGKKVNGAVVQGFLYEDRLRLLAELDGSGAIVARFVYGSRPNVPDYLIKGGSTYRILADQLGSPRLVVDTGTSLVAQRLDYDEFGRVTLNTNPGFQPFGFAGGLYDTDTKLLRLGARDYDAQTGRWTAKDPIKFRAHDPNLYRYVLDDPVNRADPSGLLVICTRLELAPRTFFCFSLDGGLPFTDFGFYDINNPPCSFNCFFRDPDFEAGRLRGRNRDLPDPAAASRGCL